MVIADMNARVGESEVEGVIGKFEVSEMNEKGRNLIELCVKKKKSVGNTFFEKNDIHKFTWASEEDGRKSLLSLIVMKEKDR